MRRIIREITRDNAQTIGPPVMVLDGEGERSHLAATTTGVAFYPLQPIDLTEEEEDEDGHDAAGATVGNVETKRETGSRSELHDPRDDCEL